MKAAVAVEGRRERKKRELREHIYETARQLFLEHGFETTTVEQIAEAADIAQATFFNHFQSKNAVLAEMTGEVVGRLNEFIEEQLARPVSAQERITGFTDRTTSEIAQARSLAHNVLLELMGTGRQPGKPVPYLARVNEAFAAIINQGQQRGEVRSDLDEAFLAEMVVGAVNATLTNWMNDPEYPLESRMREAAAFIGEAIRPHGESGND